jgi:hypothetical protein
MTDEVSDKVARRISEVIAKVERVRKTIAIDGPVDLTSTIRATAAGELWSANEELIRIREGKPNG